MGQQIALCKKCHGELSDQIVSNYKAMEQFAEGARFLEEFGRTEEDPCVLKDSEEDARVSTRPSRCWRRSRGDSEVLGCYESEPGECSPIHHRTHCRYILYNTNDK